MAEREPTEEELDEILIYKCAEELVSVYDWEEFFAHNPTVKEKFMSKWKEEVHNEWKQMYLESEEDSGCLEGHTLKREDIAKALDEESDYVSCNRCGVAVDIRG